MHRSADHTAHPYGAGRTTPQRRLIADAAVGRDGAFSVDALAAPCSRAAPPAATITTT